MGRSNVHLQDNLVILKFLLTTVGKKWQTQLIDRTVYFLNPNNEFQGSIEIGLEELKEAKDFLAAHKISKLDPPE